MGDDSGHKVVGSDNGWVLDSEYIVEEESGIVSESDGNTAMFTVKMSRFSYSPPPKKKKKPTLCSC